MKLVRYIATVEVNINGSVVMPDTYETDDLFNFVEKEHGNCADITVVSEEKADELI